MQGRSPSASVVKSSLREVGNPGPLRAGFNCVTANCCGSGFVVVFSFIYSFIVILPFLPGSRQT